MLALEQLAKKWPFSAGGGRPTDPTPLPPDTGLSFQGR